MGVRRAMEIVLAEAHKGDESIFTLGPLIHNNQVLELLESKGINTVEDISGLENGTIVIRAHGIPPQQRKLLKSSGLKIIDATCPRVARVQSLIRYHTNKGYTAIIVGDMNHPEVIGLVGYSNNRAHVITDATEVSNLPATDKFFIVTQTTQDEQNYQRIVDAIKKRFHDTLSFDTICDATRNRQKEVRTLARDVDGVVVVGGYHSGNTRRLVQVSEAAGATTFHVETEKDLDKKSLSSMEAICVTAGASTPNWMIRSVVKEIEAIRSRRETFLGQWIKNTLKFLLLGNFLVALGAFFLSYAASILSNRGPDLIHPSLAFLYIYAMHVFNRFLDKGASTYNDPERATFYRNHRTFLILTGIASIIGALALSYHFGTSVFFAMVGLSILGIIYSIPIVPIRPRHGRYLKIKDIPGSKTLSEALAWGVVITLLPLLESVRVEWTPSIISFLFVFSMVYVRSALFDIFQVQGDLIVGVETLPITLGEKKTLRLLKGIIALTTLIVLAAAFFNLVGPFSFLLLVCFLSLTFCLFIYEKRWLYPGTRLEYLVEGNLFLSGLLGLIWQILL